MSAEESGRLYRRAKVTEAAERYLEDVAAARRRSKVYEASPP